MQELHLEPIWTKPRCRVYYVLCRRFECRWYMMSLALHTLFDLPRVISRHEPIPALRSLLLLSPSIVRWDEYICYTNMRSMMCRVDMQRYWRCVMMSVYVFRQDMMADAFWDCVEYMCTIETCLSLVFVDTLHTSIFSTSKVTNKKWLHMMNYIIIGQVQRIR